MVVGKYYITKEPLFKRLAMNINNIKKIMIFGRSGSGKSTFAYHLHEALDLPLHHLDKYFFINNWIERDYGEFLSIQQNLVDGDAWIIDGNSIRSLEMRYSRADIVLYFNYPRWICYYRIFKRLLFRNRAIDDRAPGCTEKVGIKLLKYMWSFDNRVEKLTKDLKAKYPGVEFVAIKNDRELKVIKDRLLAEL